MPLVIPAIDIFGGKVVRLVRGDFSQQTVYSDNPLEIVRFFVSKGFKRIHIVDLEGAKGGEFSNLGIVKEIKDKFKDNVVVQFGGGIRSYELAKMAIDACADFIVVGTIFVKKPQEFEKILNEFREKLILSLDINIDKVVIHGWQSDVDLSVEEAFGKAVKMGVRRIMSTDVTRDGTLLGPDISHAKNILEILKEKYVELILSKVSEFPEIQSIMEEIRSVIIEDANEFMNVFKNPFTSNYELRKSIEEHDKRLSEYKSMVLSKLEEKMSDIFKQYVKPQLILSGGISSDSDIDEVFKLDNSFLEGVIVGKAIYEGRLSMFK
jgi:phosphoribosylformimino-5-aminoimidazole carboxamide ribotide isomerase